MQLGGFLRINKLSETGSKFIKISSETNLLSGLLNSVRWRARGRARTWEMPGLSGRRFGTIYWIIVGVSINLRMRGPQLVSGFPESTVHILLARALSGKQLSEDLLASGSPYRRGLAITRFHCHTQQKTSFLAALRKSHNFPLDPSADRKLITLEPVVFVSEELKSSSTEICSVRERFLGPLSPWMLAAREILPGLGDLGFPPSFCVSEERDKVKWEFVATGA